MNFEWDLLKKDINDLARKLWKIQKLSKITETINLRLSKVKQKQEEKKFFAFEQCTRTRTFLVTEC